MHICRSIKFLESLVHYVVLEEMFWIIDFKDWKNKYINDNN
jgi:hypothetical protein